MPDYDYSGLIASTWDLHRPDAENWPDAAFYKEIKKGYGEPVLDLGCATGRILLPFMEQGVDIDGVDNSPELLEICRQKAQARGLRPNLYQQDLIELDLPRRYRTIIGASSVLQLVTEESHAHQMMERLFDHLDYRSVLIASFAFEWREGDPLDTGWEPHFTVTRPTDGAIVRSFTREWHEPEKRLWNAEQRIEVELDGKIVAEEHHQRLPEGRTYTQEQAIELFRQAGFAGVHVFHEFTQEPARPGDRLFCVQGVTGP